MKTSKKTIQKRILMVVATIIVAFLALLFDRYRVVDQNGINFSVIFFYVAGSIVLAAPVLITFSLLESARKQSRDKLTTKQLITSFILFVLPVLIVFISSNLPRFIVKGNYIPAGSVALDGIQDYITIRLVGYILALLSSIIAVIYFIVNICKKTAGKVFWWLASTLSVIFAIMIGVSLMNLIADQNFYSAKLFGYWTVAGPVYALFVIAFVVDKILTSGRK